MSTYFVENISNPVAAGHDYPGLRIDAANETNAAAAFRAQTNAQPGDKLRIVLDGPNFVFFFDVAAGAPVVNAAPSRPALPANGQ